MSKGVITKQYLQDIANSIRDCNGDNKQYKPNEMAQEIYDMSYHLVPVQIVSVTPIQTAYVTLYSTTIRIVNDKPDKFPNLLYTNVLTKAGVENLGNKKIRVTYSKINSNISELNSIDFNNSQDENHLEGVVTLTYDLRTKDQIYFVYGKRR